MVISGLLELSTQYWDVMTCKMCCKHPSKQLKLINVWMVSLFLGRLKTFLAVFRLFGNHIAGFPTRRLNCQKARRAVFMIMESPGIDTTKFKILTLALSHNEMVRNRWDACALRQSLI